ncbi:MAG: 30S ribosome-binding factor RbfA [Chloroflexi bacterium]|nr:30S ribosome-binding factor RbfA [Chloroflexota bacterium]
MTRRQERLNEQIREEVSDIMVYQLKDPRLGGLVTITQVSVSPDMKHATVYVSVMEEERKEPVLHALVAASGFIRRELGRRLTIRYIPELDFKRDDSLEQGAHMLELIRQVSPPVAEKKTRKKKA